jgi:hypothetical protein
MEQKAEIGASSGKAVSPQGAVILPRNTYIIQMKVLEKPEPIRTVKHSREK